MKNFVGSSSTKRGPDAVISSAAMVDATVTVSTSGSKPCPGSKLARYTLNYGDGSSVLAGLGKPPDPFSPHTFSVAGPFTIGLQVWDANGLTDIDTADITAVLPVVIVDPPPGPTGIYGPMASIVPPLGAVLIPAGSTTASRQALINTYSTGTVFALATGVHTANGNNLPKSGQKFIGQYGAIIDGTGWSSNGDLDAAFFRGINNGVTGVTIQNLELRYGPEYGVNAYLNASGWTIDHCDLHHNRNGVSFGIAQIVSYNRIHHNEGHRGDGNSALRGGGYLAVGAQGAQMIYNEIAYNGTEQKFGHVAPSVNRDWLIAHNWVHHNVGNGIWNDGDGQGGIVENNVVEDNGGAGIDMEQNNLSTVRNNTVRRHLNNEGIYLTITRGCTVTGNICEGNLYGIGLYMDFVSIFPNSGDEPWHQDLRDNTISGNTIRVGVGQWGSALTIVGTGDSSPYYTNTKNNNWSGNTYQAPDITSNWFQWSNANKSFTQWKALPQDAVGSTLTVG